MVVNESLREFYCRGIGRGNRAPTRSSRFGEDFYGISIAVTIHSLDPSLCTRLISYERPVVVPLVTHDILGIRNGGEGSSIALIIHSLDSTLQVKTAGMHRRAQPR